MEKERSLSCLELVWSVEASSYGKEMHEIG